MQFIDAKLIFLLDWKLTKSRLVIPRASAFRIQMPTRVKIIPTTLRTLHSFVSVRNERNLFDGFYRSVCMQNAIRYVAKLKCYFRWFQSGTNGKLYSINLRNFSREISGAESTLCKASESFIIVTLIVYLEFRSINNLKRPGTKARDVQKMSRHNSRTLSFSHVHWTFVKYHVEASLFWGNVIHKVSPQRATTFNFTPSC